MEKDEPDAIEKAATVIRDNRKARRRKAAIAKSADKSYARAALKRAARAAYAKLYGVKG